MHPAMMSWWRSRHDHGNQGDCGAEASCGPGGGWTSRQVPRDAARHDEGSADDPLAGGHFGVRRPLRFLAYKLELDEKQVEALATIISELKTERAQADVDSRRALMALADATGGESFDQGRADEGGRIRVESAERLRGAVSKALASIHALLDPEQRRRLAYLIRTGTLQI